VYKERTMMNDFMRSRVADGRAGREAMLARRRFDICVALCGVCVASGYSVAITLGAHRPASAISSSNSDSSGNVSLHNSNTHTRTHTHTFNGPFSRTTRVSRYEKGKTNLDFTEARDSEWQWHQLGHVQVCTSLQTDNHTSNPPLSFLQAGCPSCRPTNSVKALKG